MKRTTAFVFLFCRAPYTMWDFNHLLLRLPLLPRYLWQRDSCMP
jgi:hypothetical protein